MYIAKFQLSNKLQSNFIGIFNFTKITYNIQMSKKCQDVVRNKKDKAMRRFDNSGSYIAPFASVWESLQAGWYLFLDYLIHLQLPNLQ